MVKATGIPATGYSVTLPQFADAGSGVNPTNYLPDAEALGLLNIRYVVSDFDMIVDGLAQITRINEYRIYENQYSHPRSWLQSSDGTETEVEILVYSPNQIILHAEGPGRLFLAEIAYPGWRGPGGRWSFHLQSGLRDLIRSVELGEGSHEIRFIFRPLTAYVGAGISLLTMFLLIGMGILYKTRKR